MRHNIFYTAHRPLKLALISTCISLDQQHANENTNSADVIKKISEVLYIFKEQIRNESTYILPIIFDYEPSIWNMYTAQHHKGMNQLRDLEDLISAFKKAEDEQKAAMISLISGAYNEFMLFNFHHMDDEEEVINEILWRYYKDTYLLEVEAAFKTLHPAVKQQHATAALTQTATAA